MDCFFGAKKWHVLLISTERIIPYFECWDFPVHVQEISEGAIVDIMVGLRKPPCFCGGK